MTKSETIRKFIAFNIYVYIIFSDISVQLNKWEKSNKMNTRYKKKRSKDLKVHTIK